MSQLSNKGREWLTEGEIKNIVLEEYKAVHSELRDAFARQNGMLERQNILLDKIADGAQAQILSSTILHGNITLGLKGALPDLIERVTHLECSQVEDRGLANDRHDSNTVRLDHLEAGQRRITRFVAKLFRWAVTNPEGQIDYKKVTAIATIVGTVVHLFLTYFSWTNIKMAVAKLMYLFR